ncbi:MAG TPA: hypothetical protein VH188_00605 [Chthoniobacterales bacterium]|nr:hypothetical protein [Chthoniobacterales bacterium]
MTILSGCGVNPGIDGGGAGLVWAGGTTAGAAADVVGGTEGPACGALGKGRGLNGGALVGFGCPKTGVSAARHSATAQIGRSTRFM